MAKTDEFNYETKCRRCDNFQDWFHTYRTRLEWIEFANTMMDFTKEPRLLYCQICNKDTVQDVVSYTSIRDIQNDEKNADNS